MLYIGSDHGGFELKKNLAIFLTKKNIPFQDLGASFYDSQDDYPVYAEKVARAVMNNTHNLGILLCKSGQGVCIVANKFSGIRAALAWDIASTKSSRNDDNANILCLSANTLSKNHALTLIATWLATPFSREQRHKRRIEKIKKIEKILLHS